MDAAPRQLAHFDPSSLPTGAAAGTAEAREEQRRLITSFADLVGPTSGQAFPLATDDSVSRVFKAMLDDFRASYVLQYVPHGVAADGWHEVSVTVNQHPKYEIRARKGYKGRSKITLPEVIR